MEKALEVNSLTVSYGNKKVLEDISFSIDRGDFLIIIGPNGAGKTTLIKAILGTLPYSGDVKMFGKSTKKIYSFKGIAGYVPQRFEFDRTFPVTVYEIINMVIDNKVRDSYLRRKKVEELLEKVGMKDYINSRVGSLSGGQIQRVLIARAIANDPTIVFFDEPLAGVDIKGEESFYELINSLKEERNLTVVLVSHDVTVVNLYANKIAALNRVMVGFGRPENVLVRENIENLYGKDVGIFGHRQCLERQPGETLAKELGKKTGKKLSKTDISRTDICCKLYRGE